MRGGIWPPVLLFAALAFALAFVPVRARLWAIPALVISAALASRISFPPGWHEAIFLACWISVILAALAVHLRTGTALAPPLLLAINTGFWAGAVTAIAGDNRDLLREIGRAHV